MMTTEITDIIKKYNRMDVDDILNDDDFINDFKIITNHLSKQSDQTSLQYTQFLERLLSKIDQGITENKTAMQDLSGKIGSIKSNALACAAYTKNDKR